MLLRLVRFVYIDMCPIPHASAYRPESKLLKTDGDRWTMLRMGPIHARDNSQGVSGTELNVPLGTKTCCTPEWNRMSPLLQE